MSPLPAAAGRPEDVQRGSTALTVIGARGAGGEGRAGGRQEVAGADRGRVEGAGGDGPGSRSASGSWSVTTTLVAGPAPALVTVMVKEAVSPGWITSNPPVTALVIVEVRQQRHAGRRAGR